VAGDRFKFAAAQYDALNAEEFCQLMAGDTQLNVDGTMFVRSETAPALRQRRPWRE
jgi:hypothetical protein